MSTMRVWYLCMLLALLCTSSILVLGNSDEAEQLVNRHDQDMSGVSADAADLEIDSSSDEYFGDIQNEELVALSDPPADAVAHSDSSQDTVQDSTLNVVTEDTTVDAPVPEIHTSADTTADVAAVDTENTGDIASAIDTPADPREETILPVEASPSEQPQDPPVVELVDTTVEESTQQAQSHTTNMKEQDDAQVPFTLEIPRAKEVSAEPIKIYTKVQDLHMHTTTHSTNPPAPTQHNQEESTHHTPPPPVVEAPPSQAPKKDVATTRAPLGPLTLLLRSLLGAWRRLGELVLRVFRGGR
eukprot:gene29058-35072_t